MKRVFMLLLVYVMLMGVFSGCGAQANILAADISEKVINSGSNFAFDLFKTLNDEDADKNIFISPFSVSSALTMAYNGAETETKAAMEKVLGLEGMDRVQVNKDYKTLLGRLTGLDKKVQINIGNSIWIRDGEKINEEFIKTNKNNFNAQVSSLDFSQVSAADRINQWISDSTKGKITKMIDPPISPDVIMYLINAIYFKGPWAEQFKPKDTVDADFHTYNGAVQTVKMMSRNSTVEYGRGDDYKAVRLPYGNGKISMNIILPNEGIDINEYIKTIDTDMWNTIRESINKADDVQLQIPKFKLEYGIKDLTGSLKAMGMGVAFSDQADFSGIRNDLFISSVLHKAVIEVNEEGSEAAAATSVEVSVTALAEPITFICNRPFIFLILDDATGTIMFMGKVLSI